VLDIGKKIRELRQSKKLTQKELAKILNVTPQAISKWERNESNPDIQTILNLSDYFNVSVDEILGKKIPTFFENLFSKMKGSQQMGEVQNKIANEKLVGKKDMKRVMIFDIVFSFITDQGLLQTQALNRKLSLLMKDREKNITIETYNSNKVNQYGEQADIILLTPTFGYAKDEIEEKFPKTPVIAISKRDYGMLNVEKLYSKIVEMLGAN
jgi:transcriptional regulator with XRE-family HTH domain/cellobiose-specific phosphotransferase system component IIB